MNSIALALKYTPKLDEIFQREATSIDLEDTTVNFDGVDTVKILKVKVPDNADYSRSSGFTTGDVEATWETWQLTQDRGREFNVDAVDNEETLDQTFGAVSGEFIRTKVIPEVDLYRYATVASKSGISGTIGVLTTGDQVVAAISAAMTQMDEDEVPTENRLLYITPTCKRLIDALETYKSQKVMEGFSKVIQVPQSRFLTKITKNTEKKFVRHADGSFINFMIIHKSAAKAVSKHVRLRIFLANGDDDTGVNRNQDMDAHKFQYRNVHDCFVYDNKVAGIYCHSVPLVAITVTAGSGASADVESFKVPSGTVAKVDTTNNKITLGDVTVTITPPTGKTITAVSGVTNGTAVSANATITFTYSS